MSSKRKMQSLSYYRRRPAAMLLSPLHLRWCLFRCFFLLFSRIPVNGRQFSQCTNRIQQTIWFSVTMSACYWNPSVLASPCHPLPMDLRELLECVHCGLAGSLKCFFQQVSQLQGGIKFCQYTIIAPYEYSV